MAYYTVYTDTLGWGGWWLFGEVLGVLAGDTIEVGDRCFQGEAVLSQRTSCKLIKCEPEMSSGRELRGVCCWVSVFNMMVGDTMKIMGSGGGERDGM